MSEQVAVTVRIKGRVQGVGFRDWTWRRATSLGVSGWVRNCANGDVEAAFSGGAGAVETMLEACRRGPRMAEVAAVQIMAAESAHEGSFTIRSDSDN